MRTGAFSCRRLADIGVTLLTVLVTATPLSAGILDASWTAPTTNADGTALTDLALYRVYYGTTASVCPGSTSISVVSPTPAPGANQTVATPITGLTAGTRYYTAVTAVDLGGNASGCSAVASAVARDDTSTDASLTLAYNGKLRDRVGAANVGVQADGALDGALTVTLAAAGGRTITRVQLHSSAPGTWDTDASTAAWALGVATSLDGALLNDAGTSAVNFGVADGGSFQLFAADWSDIEFVPGTALTVTATFSDGTTASASTVAGTTPGPASLTVGYNGKLRDRVGQGNVGLGADGALDGTLTVTLAAIGGRTITRLQLQSSAPGSWDTDASTAAWVLGVAATLDGALLNDAATGAVNFAVADGGSFQLFAADWANVEFASGTTLTVTATLSDGSQISGRVTLP